MWVTNMFYDHSTPGHLYKVYFILTQDQEGIMRPSDPTTVTLALF